MLETFLRYFGLLLLAAVGAVALWNEFGIGAVIAYRDSAASRTCGRYPAAGQAFPCAIQRRGGKASSQKFRTMRWSG